MHNNLIITGSAPGVLIDIAAVPCVCPYDFMSIGLTASGMHKIPVKYMATYHPNLIPETKARRESVGGNTDYIVISHQDQSTDGKIKYPGVDIVEPLVGESGSSALLGSLAAIKLGYSRIILCGCPLTGKNDKGGSYETFRAGWKKKKDFLNDRVRSMSGWTAELLGRPTDEWLSEGL